MGFDRLVGHRRVKDLLVSVVARSAVHPAFLFAGPPGVGKHLAALEFARAFLCQQGTSGSACGACDSCKRVGAGTHQDLIEVTFEDKKKSLGVEQVRNLGEWLAQSPSLGRRKAAIIDPADALTVPAANAMLKTLEEPPPGRVVVLVATSPGALPVTVRSRCQRIFFGSLSDDEVAEVLRRNGWPAQSARQAAAMAEGSPGAALAGDGRALKESSDAVLGLLEASGSGQRGPALAFAEAAGETRERALTTLQAIAAHARIAVRQRLRGTGRVDAPGPLGDLEPDQIARLLAAVLETMRRLEGDRPPNAKLALATLLTAAAGGAARQPDR